MILNKNISIWRGYNAPPTLNHLWVDENNNIKININNEWVSLLEIILKQWDNVVTLEDTQTITGNKTFTSPINLNNYSIIRSSTNNGEFKVTHYNSEKGFIIRTNLSNDKNILPLEILSTDGNQVLHLYKFPEKSGTLLVDSDMQSFKDEINTNITTETLQRINSDTALGNRINNIENNIIPKAVTKGIAQVVANAPEDLDTLKEVADYIASDKTKASQIETAISNLQKADAQLANSINANAKALVDKVNKSDLDELATKEKVQLMTETTATISPNILYVWGEVAELNITLAEGEEGVVNEYMVQFTSGAAATTLTLPESIVWMSAPSIQANKTYELSIINNLGVIGEFSV